MKRESIRELKSRIAFLENVLESMPIGIMVLDGEGKLIMFNRSQERISRVERGKVLGSYFHETFKDSISNILGAETYLALIQDRKPFEHVLADVKPQFYDAKLSGIVIGAPLSNAGGAVLAFHLSDEIREDKHSLAILAKNLNESRNFLQKLTDSYPSAIFTVAHDGMIRSANMTAAHIFGYAVKDFFLKPVSMLFCEDIDLEAMLGSVSVGSGIEVMCRRMSGEPFPARLQISEVLKEDGKAREILTIITDISREKDLEEKLAISEKLAIYSELIAGIFHQINNPMVGVINFSSMLLEKMDENDANRFMVETIHKAARQCHNLISSMMKGFREPQSTFSRVAPREVLEYAIGESLRQQEEQGGQVAIVRDIEDNLPEISGDVLQLGQVFRNLIDNAFQSMPDGGTLSIRTSANLQMHEISISFSDTGCGVPIENLGKIFTPFFSTKHNTGGGLGLSFAYQVVRNHAGRIEVESKVGEGTIFTVVLPFAKRGGNGKEIA